MGGGEGTSRIVIRSVSLAKPLRALLAGNISSFIYLFCFVSAGSVQLVSFQATDETPRPGLDSGAFAPAPESWRRGFIFIKAAPRPPRSHPNRRTKREFWAGRQKNITGASMECSAVCWHNVKLHVEPMGNILNKRTPALSLLGGSKGDKRLFAYQQFLQKKVHFFKLTKVTNTARHFFFFFYTVP